MPISQFADRILTISPAQFESMLRVAAAQPKVREAIFAGHDDSRWWPKSVSDWRLRMLIAGLSARISYRMVPRYREVVDQLDSLGYDVVSRLSEEQFREVIAKLGLLQARVRVWKSLCEFIAAVEAEQLDLSRFSNAELIEVLQNRVEGASYKLAQCAVLYARGYYCGVIPVDSGMKDYLAPCLGFPFPRGALAHETLRREFETLVARIDCHRIAVELGYGELDLPRDQPLTWWAHLVLISYKRFFCNEQRPSECALRQAFGAGNRENISIGTRCDKQDPRVGGVGAVIVEGLNAAGKSVVAGLLQRCGYDAIHFGYSPERTGSDVVALFRDAFERTTDRRVVLDRSFVSEEAYGRALRGGSRLTMAQYRELLRIAKGRNAVIVYLNSPPEILRERYSRRMKTQDTFAARTVDEIRQVSTEYERALEIAAEYLPILRVDTSSFSAESVVRDIVGVETFALSTERPSVNAR